MTKGQNTTEFKKKRADEAVFQFYSETKCINTLAILPREEEALRAAGYDPKTMVCVARFDNESIFAQITVSKPVRVGLKDGGGKPYGNGYGKKF